MSRYSTFKRIEGFYPSMPEKKEEKSKNDTNNVCPICDNPSGPIMCNCVGKCMSCDNGHGWYIDENNKRVSGGHMSSPQPIAPVKKPVKHRVAAGSYRYGLRRLLNKCPECGQLADQMCDCEDYCMECSNGHIWYKDKDGIQILGNPHVLSLSDSD